MNRLRERLRSLGGLDRSRIPGWSRCAEFGLLFIVLPVSLALLKREFEVQILIPALIVAAIVCGLILRWDPEYRSALARRSPQRRRTLRAMSIRFAIGAPLLLAYVAVFEPDRLGYLPLHQPGIWLMVVTLYPLLSVYPQELIYRAFFLHRFRSLPGSPASLIALNSFAFSLAHLYFWNVPALVLTALAGAIFTINYLRGQSILLVCLEHAVWGNWIFTIGLGHYFYGGATTGP